MGQYKLVFAPFCNFKTADKKTALKRNRWLNEPNTKREGQYGLNIHTIERNFHMREDKKQPRARKKELVTWQRQDLVNSIKEAITGKKSFGIHKEYLEQYYYKEKTEFKKHSKYTKKEKITFVLAGATLANIVLLAWNYLYSFIHLQRIILTNNSIYLAMASILPFVTWVIASDEDFWAFHKRKRVFFYACCLNLILTLLQPVYTTIANLIIPHVLKIPTNPLLTRRMVMFLAYVIVMALFILTVYIFYIEVEPLVLSDYIKRQIETFRFELAVGNLKSNPYSYDTKIVKDLETGKPITIPENDRYVQTVLNGPSGTGKSTSVMESQIEEILDKKVANREKRQEALLTLIYQKKATLQGPLREFDESAIIPIGKTKGQKEKNAKEIEKIRKKYPDCGITFVAPNNAINEHIIAMADVRDIKVNEIDPIYCSYPKFSNVKKVRVNPFYIPFGLKEDERILRIAEAANVYADVLIATNQMDGQSDVYFTDISLSVSYNISSVIMLANNILGKTTYIDDVQDCTSEFENLKSYVEVIENHFGIEVVVSEPQKQNNGKIDAETIAQRMNTGNNVIPKKAAAAKKNPYYQQLVFVKKELLGAGAEAMYSHARGLRNLTNKILQDPRIKRSLSAEEDERLDFDRIFSHNEITVVNTAIELGKNISTSFGLFFLLNHRSAVLRRPKETRTPHFFFNDECAQYVHPFYDDVIALYRQYRVAALLTLQTLTQLEKSRATAYLKNVFLGAGTHIVFGRLGPEEMKIYSEMAGVSRKMEVQKSVSESDIFASNPSRQEAERFTPKVVNNLEGSDMRLLGFLELTIFTINKGRVLSGRLGRVFFVGPDAYEKRKLRRINWEEVAPEAFREPKATEDTIAQNESENAITYDDRIRIEDEEVVMIQKTAAENLIEGADEMSLNELYTLLLKGSKQENSYVAEEEELDDSDTDIDYAAAIRTFNNTKRG